MARDYGLGKTWQGVIIGKIMSKHITQGNKQQRKCQMKLNPLRTLKHRCYCLKITLYVIKLYMLRNWELK